MGMNPMPFQSARTVFNVLMVIGSHDMKEKNEVNTRQLGEEPPKPPKKPWSTPVLQKEPARHTGTNINGMGNDGTFFS